MLADELHMNYYSVGSLMRDLAQSKGISLLEVSKLAESGPGIDKELDERQKEIACKGNCIIDSRLGAHILKPDFSIWLDAPIEVQAKRISSRDGVEESEARERISKREASERKRYSDYYGIDLGDKSVYNLVLDTGDLSKKEMIEKSLQALKAAGL
jgi:cytidylate kinase